MSSHTCTNCHEKKITKRKVEIDYQDLDTNWDGKGLTNVIKKQYYTKIKKRKKDSRAILKTPLKFRI